MPNYQKGKIYKIVNITSTDEADCYVGSTCVPLCKRLSSHKHAVKVRKEETLKDGSLYYMMNKLGASNFRIVLIEEYPCNSKEQLLSREEHHRIQLKAKYNIIPAHNNKVKQPAKSYDGELPSVIGRRIAARLKQLLRYGAPRTPEDERLIKEYGFLYADGVWSDDESEGY